MDFLASVALSSVVVIVVLILAVVLFSLWQQGWGDDRPVLIEAAESRSWLLSGATEGYEIVLPQRRLHSAPEAHQRLNR